MATGFFLLDHPNPHHTAATPHWHTTRPGSVLAIVVHITAGLEDLDGHADQSAEATGRFAATTDRPVSWHSGSDADSAFDLLPAAFTAFQVRGYNSRTYGHEISKHDPDWRHAPPVWAQATLRVAARHLGPRARQLGVPIRHATRAELDHAIATGGPAVGFIGHDVLDPTRRRDPGRVGGIDTFPWEAFLALAREFAGLPGPTPPPPAPAPVPRPRSLEDDMFMYTTPGHPVFFCANGASVGLNEATDMPTFVKAGVPLFTLDDDTYAKFRERYPGA